jgi:hypothetical protein
MTMTVIKPPPLPVPARPRRWKTVLALAISAVAFELATGFHIELVQAASPGSI